MTDPGATPSHGIRPATPDSAESSPTDSVPLAPAPNQNEPDDHRVPMFVASLLTYLGIGAWLLIGLLALIATMPSRSPSENMNGLVLLGVPPVLLAGFVFTGVASVIYGRCGATRRCVVLAVATAANCAGGIGLALVVR